MPVRFRYGLLLRADLLQHHSTLHSTLLTPPRTVSSTHRLTSSPLPRSYLSYRDPNLLPTLEAYDGAPDFLRTLELDKDGLTKAIIGTIGDIDSYQLPDAKGYTALSR